MTPLLFALEAELPLYAPLRRLLQVEPGEWEYRRFPDGESYLRIASPVAGRPCVLLADLSRPDAKFLPLQFFAATLRELGADCVGLVAPYLCYMHQDRRFQAGEAERLLRESGVNQLVTSNSIPGRSATIDLSPLLVTPIREILADGSCSHSHGDGGR